MRHETYKDALAFAESRAIETNCDQFIHRLDSRYGTGRLWVVIFAPAPEQTFGSELGYERVTVANAKAFA